jgi:hypothetical protein
MSALSFTLVGFCLHLNGQHSHWRTFEEESTSVTRTPVIAMTTPTKVKISSLDQEDWGVSGSERCVVFVCDGGAGIA